MKISEMTPGGVITGIELIPAVQDGENIQTTPDDIKTYFNAGYLQNDKIVIPAAAMLPMVEVASAYYLEGLFPSQVFSATVNQFVKVQLHDVANQIPAAANAFEIRFISRRGTAVDGEVLWRAEAAWINLGDTAISYGTAQDFSSEHNSAAIVISDAGTAVTPSGTRTAGAELRIRLSRQAESESDDMATTAQLLWVELEFVTVE